MPGEDEQWHEQWLENRLKWWESVGVPREKIQVKDVAKEDLAHYSKRTYDLEYAYPHGYDEIEGIANRTDYDLGNHTKQQAELNLTAKVHENTHSNSRMAVQIIEEGQPPRWVVPFVIEPSAGVERAMLAVLNEAYTEETLPDAKDGESTRLVLKLKPHLSPIKAAVIPLAKNKPELVAKAQELKAALQKLGLGRVLLEMSGNVGKAYRKHDEIGTPVCLTIDFQTLDDATVTLRHRDTMQQERLALADVPARLAQLIKG